MSNDYSKTVILFPAGASGHFLSVFLAKQTLGIVPTSRIDLGQHVSTAVFVDNNLDKIKKAIMHDSHQTVLSHFLEISQLDEFHAQHWIRKISPQTNFFGFLKNIFYKKQQVEMTNWDQAGFVERFDAMFENMYQWYYTMQHDTDCPATLTIDFGKLNDIEFLKELFYEVNGIAPDDKKLEFAKQYLEKQFDPIHDCNFLNINDIIDQVQPKDLYDIVIVLFMYEKNHNTIDKNRLWTINDLPTNLDDSLRFIVSNAKNYTIF